MRKIISIVLASMALLFFSFTSSMADWTAGLSATGGVYEAEGSETQEGDNEKSTATEEAKFYYPSIFVEYNTGTVSIGIEVIPGSVETDEAQRTDINAGDKGLTTGNDAGAVNKVSVDISQHITLYGLVPIMDTGAYLKAGISRMDVATNESLGTGSTYGDEENVPGAHIGLGYQHDTDGGFVRAEIGYSAYENISLTATNTTNKVEADIQGGFARISIGRSF